MSTDRSGGRLRFLDQSDAEAAQQRARLDAVTRLAGLTQRTRQDVEREAAALGVSAFVLAATVGGFLVGLLMMIAVSAGTFACVLALPAHSLHSNPDEPPIYP